MAFSPAQGTWVMQYVPKPASTTLTKDMMLYNDGTNTAVATTTTQGNVNGILQEAYASSDATTVSVGVLVPTTLDCTFYGDMYSTETISAESVGDQFDFAAGGLTISTTSTYDTVTLVKFISTTKGEFKLNVTFGIEN